MRDAEGRTTGIEVRAYFEVTDGEIETWRFGAAPAEEKENVAPFRVPRFHRTITSWLNLLIASGFVVEHLHEPACDAETARRLPYLDDTTVAPLFLHVRVRKPA